MLNEDGELMLNLSRNDFLAALDYQQNKSLVHWKPLLKGRYHDGDFSKIWLTILDWRRATVSN